MQWDTTANAGFSSAEPQDLYIQIDPDEARPTVESERTNPGGIYQEVKKLIALRKEHEALQSLAHLEFVYAEKETYPFVYKRMGKEEDILVILNPSGEEAVCRIPVQEAGEVIYENNGAASLKDGELRVPGASVTFFSYKK